LLPSVPSWPVTQCLKLMPWFAMTDCPDVLLSYASAAPSV
jgi:hypothetical protein